LQLVELLLFNNREMGGYIGAVSEQRLGEYFPAEADTNASIEELCFLCGPCRDVISKGQGDAGVSSVQESVRRGLEPEAQE
jgi:hypothetical protein